MSYYPDLSAYYAAAAANPFTAAAAVRLAAASPPMKRARVIVPPPASPIGSPRTVIAKSPSTPPARKPQGTVCLDDLHTYCGGQDIMICGNCREMFRSIAELLHHKKEYCKLRFACKCSHETQQLPKGEDVSSMLLCGLCAEPFATAWHLIEHFQDTHSVDIYRPDGEQDGSKEGGSECSSDRTGRESSVNSDGAASGLEVEERCDAASDDEDPVQSSGTTPS